MRSPLITRLILAALSVLALILLFAYTVLLKPNASASQELKVISQTRGNEELTALVLNNQVKIRLKNNHKEMLRRFEVLEQLPPDSPRQGFIELKDRAHKLFAKL